MVLVKTDCCCADHMTANCSRQYVGVVRNRRARLTDTADPVEARPPFDKRCYQTETFHNAVDNHRIAKGMDGLYEEQMSAYSDLGRGAHLRALRGVRLRGEP
jgi:hypothetical protein